MDGPKREKGLSVCLSSGRITHIGESSWLFVEKGRSQSEGKIESSLEPVGR